MNNVIKNILGATMVSLVTIVGLGVCGIREEKRKEEKAEFKMFDLKAEQ